MLASFLVERLVAPGFPATPLASFSLLCKPVLLIQVLPSNALPVSFSLYRLSLGNLIHTPEPPLQPAPSPPSATDSSIQPLPRHLAWLPPDTNTSVPPACSACPAPRQPQAACCSPSELPVSASGIITNQKLSAVLKMLWFILFAREKISALRGYNIRRPAAERQGKRRGGPCCTDPTGGRACRIWNLRPLRQPCLD